MSRESGVVASDFEVVVARAFEGPELVHWRGGLVSSGSCCCSPYRWRSIVSYATYSKI